MKLSIIIPAFNCEEYISKCLNSLIEQTNSAFEIIVVDDGSKDNSRQIAIDNLKDRTNSIILSQENRGVSEARNLGIQYANGEYLSFIDSDDYVLSNYVEVLLNSLKDVDFLQSGTLYSKGNDLLRKNIPPVDEWNLDILKNENKAHYLDFTTSIHGKIYKKEIIDQFHIRFNKNMSFAEDRDFNIEYISHIKSARNIEYAGYCYQVGVDGSLSSKFYSYKFENDIRYWNKVYKVLGSSNNDYLSHQLFYYLIDNFVLLQQKLGMKEAVKELCRIKRTINRVYLKNNINYVKAPAWQKLAVKYIL